MFCFSLIDSFWEKVTNKWRFEPWDRLFVIAAIRPGMSVRWINPNLVDDAKFIVAGVLFLPEITPFQS
ncbi:MAG: hypothetical protein GXO74_03005 [Calditrichaeota bacterium]|nr:hypothetical protein [Calditrichota bacterium]